MSSQILAADILVVASPTFKGSYTGLFKHVFDLLDPSSLRGKPVILAATGGGERHSLMVEHQLRPLFGFFEALAMPTAIYASDKDFADGALASEASMPASAGRSARQRRRSRAPPGQAWRPSRKFNHTNPVCVGYRSEVTPAREANPTEAAMTRQIKLGAFLPGGGQHIAAWRHPDAPADGATNFEFHRRLAETAERGLFDAYFLADNLSVGLGGREGGNAKIAGFEPVTLFAALAPLTTHLGFIATASTTYEEPYTLARKFASLDLLSNGRAGWNVVTSAGDETARNFNRETQPSHADRYERAHEHVETVKALWDSWEDDAFIRDKATGRFFDAGRVHDIDHKAAFQRQRTAERAASRTGAPGRGAGGAIRGRTQASGGQRRGDLHRPSEPRFGAGILP